MSCVSPQSISDPHWRFQVGFEEKYRRNTIAVSPPATSDLRDAENQVSQLGMHTQEAPLEMRIQRRGWYTTDWDNRPEGPRDGTGLPDAVIRQCPDDDCDEHLTESNLRSFRTSKSVLGVSSAHKVPTDRHSTTPPPTAPQAKQARPGVHTASSQHSLPSLQINLLPQPPQKPGSPPFTPGPTPAPLDLRRRSPPARLRCPECGPGVTSRTLLLQQALRLRLVHQLRQAVDESRPRSLLRCALPHGRQVSEFGDAEAGGFDGGGGGGGGKEGGD